MSLHVLYVDDEEDLRLLVQSHLAADGFNIEVAANGLTALFNSVAKADAANGGAVTNFKISRELFTNSRPKLEAMFSSYFDRGGQEATVTVVNRNDLEAALKEPEKYAHVLVRLGGWCARFIDLEPKIQQEIIKRTLY